MIKYMKTTKILTFIIIIILFSLSHNTYGAIISPPAVCDPNSYTRIRGGTFSFREFAPQYTNGLLTIKMAFNSSNENREFIFYGYLLNGNDCSGLDSVYEATIHIPEGVADISLRFTGESTFAFYNDQTNLPLECDNCTNTLMPPQPAPYKFRFNIYTNFNSHSVETKPYDVKDPNFNESITPTLIIPGTLATEIYKGEDKLWVDLIRLIATNNDRFMDPLGFNEDATPLDNSLTLGNVLDKPDAKYDYSKGLIDEFKNQNYILNNQIIFFPYDWRMDISKNASVSLKNKIDILTEQKSNKINIIAHSQGGLLIKRLLYEYPEYNNKINKLIFVGTPHLGSPKSFKVLREGDQLGVKLYKILGLDPEEIIRISKNMPSIYQMLPSPEYFNHYSGYWGKLDRNLFEPNKKVIFDYSTTKQKLKDAGFNSYLLDANDEFHSFEYDQFNFTGTGIDVYNIVGCQTPTYGGVIQKSLWNDKILWEPGDETVPLKSATNIINVKTIYSLDATHSTMLTQEGVRQNLVNIITGSDLPTPGITDNITECHFNGQTVSAHSPVELHVYDQLGRHVGPTPGDGFENQIDGIGYEIIGEQKFAFLPEGSNYTIKLEATNEGTFDFYSSQIQEGQTLNTTYYNNIGITSQSKAKIDLNTTNDQIIQLDTNGDGVVDENVLPSAVLVGEEVDDLVAPISTSTLVGTMGQAKYYRGEVQVSLSAKDLIIAGSEEESSGLLNAAYKLDGGEWTKFSSSTNFTVSAEGHHILKYFATDRAGNNEEEQLREFFIDKTTPEFLIRFNPSAKDLFFSGIDNISTTSAVTVLDKDSQISLTDQAGNISVLKLTEKDRKRNLRAEIASLSYNGVLTDLSKNRLSFSWLTDRKGTIQLLTQRAVSRKNFSVTASFLSRTNQTIITEIPKNKRYITVLPGLSLLKIKTNQGDLEWSY